MQFDSFFRARNFCRAFVKKLQFPFTAYCLSITYLHQFPTKSSRFCVSGLRYKASYIVIADNSCPPLSSISITCYSYFNMIRIKCSMRYVLQDLWPSNSLLSKSSNKCQIANVHTARLRNSLPS